MKVLKRCFRAKNFIVPFALCILISYSTYVSAALIEKTEVVPIQGSDTKQKMTISGTVPLPQQALPVDREVFLEVFKPGMTEEDINSKPKNDVMQYMDETNTDPATGAYKFEFNMDGDTGNYLIRIGFYGVNDDGEREKQFAYLSPEENVRLLQGVNNAVINNDPKAMQDTIEYYIGRKVIVLPFYDLLKNEGIDLEAVFTSMIQESRFNTNPGKFNNSDDIVNCFNRAAVLVEINNAQDDTRINQIFTDTDYQKVLSFTAGPLNTYLNSLNGEKRKAVNQKFLAHSFSNLENDIRPLFNEAVVLRALSDISWYEVYDVLNNNNDALMLDFSKYNLLSADGQDAVLQHFADQAASCGSMQQLIDRFNSLVANQSQIEANNQTGHKGGSTSGRTSGSTSSGSGQVVRTVQPEEKAPVVPAFKDLQTVDWAVAAIEDLAKKGIVVGESEGYYCPDDKVTREAFVKMLMEASNLVKSDSTSEFGDVDKSAWYYQYISSAKQLGIISGKSETEFGVGDNITRKEMAVLVYRVLKMKDIKIDGTEAGDFSDTIGEEDYIREAVNAMRSVKIINGVGDNLFAPDDFSTRAQAAKIIYEFMQKLQ